MRAASEASLLLGHMQSGASGSALPVPQPQLSPIALQAAMRKAGVAYYARASLKMWVSDGDGANSRGNDGRKNSSGDDETSGSGKAQFYLELLSDRQRASAYRWRFDPRLSSCAQAEAAHLFHMSHVATAYHVIGRFRLSKQSRQAAVGVWLGRAGNLGGLSASLDCRRRGDLWAVSNNPRMACDAGRRHWVVVARSLWHGPAPDGRCAPHPGGTFRDARMAAGAAGTHSGCDCR